jgi:exopolysaccharide biosynthesis polyprenyl glycosylphosphotransferase
VAGDTPPIAAGDDSLTLRARHRRSRRVKALLGVLLVLMDVLMLVLAFGMGHLARLSLPFFDRPDPAPDFAIYIPTLILHVLVIVAMFYVSRLYHLRRTVSRFDQARSIFLIVTLGVVIANGIQEILFRNTLFEAGYPRSMLLYVWFFSVLMVGVGRELYALLVAQLRKRGISTDNLVIVGGGRVARDILGKIQRAPDLGYNPVGIVTGPLEHQGRMLGVPVIGHYRDLPQLIDQYFVDQIIIAIPDAARSELVELVTLSQRGHVDIKIYPDVFAYIAGDLNVDDLRGTPLLTVRDIALRGWKLSLKRGLDLVGAAFGLVLLSPFMLLTAILIYLESAGPVFYSQIRMGLDGKPFPILKFRSMRLDAEADGPGWTVQGDPRVTRIGRFIRKTNWDEIPQLINVLLGEMSLVGPRPERPVYVQEFRKQVPRYMERHREKAGMTGWAQVNGLRGDTSISQRTRYDVWYVENWSLWLDIKIILRTIIQTLTGRVPNAY